MEILSPASNMEHIKCAIDAKANAVYGGLKKWNARNKAINFTKDEYNELIKLLHEHNIKFFLTLNILMLDDEIDEVISFLKENTLPDAFIATDIGLIKALQQNFKEIPVHFSTQFGAHSIDDVNYIKSLDGKRAILARELTLDELENIRNNTDIELECFIWGSQCLSFSGLCFFGTLIGGGGGNRGKCIITCRDIYKANDKEGHLLYVKDMDAINLVSKLDKIDCLKLEGRRRNPREIKEVLDNINKKIKSENNVGYLYGTNIRENNIYEQINSRTKPYMKASLLPNITDFDVCLLYDKGVPISFSKDYQNPNVMYIYTELKRDYQIDKKNLAFDITLENNIIKEVLYMNFKGDGHTFYGNSDSLVAINFQDFINNINQKNKNINIYKIKYRRTNNKPILISENTLNEIITYVLNDCKDKNYTICNNKLKLKKIFLETDNESVLNEFINDSFVKLIYNIKTVNNLKNIKDMIKKYGDKIIYKLPLFNFKSIDLTPYLKELENMEVMFTRFTQIYLCKNIKFKKTYADYTIYVWNKKTLSYLKENNISEFTASPELSYETNQKIFDATPMQVIIGGKLPLVFTRNCFSHLFNCTCQKKACKTIKNVDKNLLFDIYCTDSYRYLLNKEPFLNNYQKVDVSKNTLFRYVTSNEDIYEIKKIVDGLKQEDYYASLHKLKYFQNAYECNLLEGKE